MAGTEQTNEIHVGIRLSRGTYEWLVKKSVAMKTETGVRIPIGTLARGVIDQARATEEKKRGRK